MLARSKMVLVGKLACKPFGSKELVLGMLEHKQVVLEQNSMLELEHRQVPLRKPLLELEHTQVVGKQEPVQDSMLVLKLELGNMLEPELVLGSKMKQALGSKRVLVLGSMTTTCRHGAWRAIRSLASWRNTC